MQLPIDEEPEVETNALIALTIFGAKNQRSFA
jgi:hypothetical protein